MTLGFERHISNAFILRSCMAGDSHCPQMRSGEADTQDLMEEGLDAGIPGYPQTKAGFQTVGDAVKQQWGPGRFSHSPLSVLLSGWSNISLET